MSREVERVLCGNCSCVVGEGEQNCRQCGEPTVYMSFDERARRELELYREWKARESA